MGAFKKSVDSVIVSAYVKLDVPADRIVADPDMAVTFLASVNAGLPPGEQKLELAELNKHLLNLRRRGEANGGLPRLRRTFGGRNNKPR